MTIQNLLPFLKKCCPQVIRPATLADFQHRKLYVDMFPLLYRYRSRASDDATSADVLEHFVNDHKKLLDHDITPVYVFDGPKKPPEKWLTLRQRDERRATQIAKGRPVLELPRHLVDDVIELIKSQGGMEKTDYFISRGDGEEMAAKLVLDGHGDDYVLSDDLDVLAFGAPHLVRIRDMEHIERARVLDELNLTPEMFVDFCILCGCDYTGKIPLVGPVRALRLIKKFCSIEAIKEEVDFDASVWKSCDFKSARWVFQRGLDYDALAAPEMTTCPLSGNDKLKVAPSIKQNLMQLGFYRRRKKREH